MSRVLKKRDATSTSAVHSLASAWSTAPNDALGVAAMVDPELLALREEQQGLRRKLEAQAAQISDLREQARSAFELGEAKGRETGLREAADQDAQRLARLEIGIAQAQAAFEQALAGLDRLAPALAYEGIASILGRSDERSQLVAALLRHQLTTIEARSIIHVDVSASDFADDGALEALGRSLGNQGPVIHASVALKSGDCRIRLKLGALDVGLDQQWGRLGLLLQDMSSPKTGASPKTGGGA